MKIIWANSARNDLNEIEAYISQDNPPAAFDTIIKIIDRVETLLERNPAIGRAGRIMGTRELVIAGTPYIVPYTVSEGRIEVLRVLHCARKWTQTLEELGKL